MQPQPNVIIHDRAAFEAALALAKGKYQRDLIRGVETLSGSSLAGKAQRWSSRYAQSRDNLLARLMAAGVGHEVRGRYRKRILVIGAPAEPAREGR